MKQSHKHCKLVLAENIPKHRLSEHKSREIPATPVFSRNVLFRLYNTTLVRYMWKQEVRTAACRVYTVFRLSVKNCIIQMTLP